MSWSNKKAAAARGFPPPFNRQAGHAPRQKMVAMQLKTDASLQAVKRPVAPCAYRPQARPNAVQPKLGHGALNRKPPVPPPVYRPQPAPKVLQTRTSWAPNPRAGQAPRQPVAPPVYRPETKKVVQPKLMSPVRKSPTAPPVYRPEQKRVAQPKVAAAAQAHTPLKAPPVYRPQVKMVRVQAKMTGAGIKNQTVVPLLYHPQAIPKVLQTRMKAALNQISVQRKMLFRNAVRSAPVVQMTYDEKNWDDEKITRNINQTKSGSSLYSKAEATANALGLKLKILPDDQTTTGVTIINNDLKLLICLIPGNAVEGDATQILAQELSNAANKRELDNYGSGESARSSKKGAYVFALEATEYPGAKASRDIFQEAKDAGAEWTKGGEARWKAAEVDDLFSYIEFINSTRASAVYERRWERHNTHLLYEEGDYQLYGLNIQEKKEAELTLLYKGTIVDKGTAKFETFGKVAQGAKLIFNAYVSKHKEGRVEDSD